MCSTLQRKLEVEFLHVGETLKLYHRVNFIIFIAKNFDFREYFAAYKTCSIVYIWFVVVRVWLVAHNHINRLIANIEVYIKFFIQINYHRFSYRYASSSASYFIQHKIHNILKLELSEYEAFYISSVVSKAHSRNCSYLECQQCHTI